MKIGITADTHLKNQEYPERWHSLKNILDQLIQEQIDTLIIAGDLFDAESQNYSEFDNLCMQKTYHQLSFHIIPGNHDPIISQKHFSAENIHIHNEPHIENFGDPPVKFFFIPYKPDEAMGPVIARHGDKLDERWILVGHGDYITGLQEPNPYEPGIYMPLTRSDIENYRPAHVFLGHIHKKSTHGIVRYPGSPCGMDINETGKRSFFVFDTDTLDIKEKHVETDHIYFNEQFIMIPVKDEFEYIKDEIKKRISKWDLKPDEISKARIRMKFRGYTSDRNLLMKTIDEIVGDFEFYKNEGVDITEVAVLSDPERVEIIEKVKEKIRQMDWEGLQTTKDDILEQALYLILNE